jgi:hypothetical protein
MTYTHALNELVEPGWPRKPSPIVMEFPIVALV